jgi:hypothetical protein
MIIEERKYIVTRLNPVNVHPHPDGPPHSLRRYSNPEFKSKTIYASFFHPVNIQPLPLPPFPTSRTARLPKSFDEASIINDKSFAMRYQSMCAHFFGDDQYI